MAWISPDFEQIAQRFAAGVLFQVDRLEHRHDRGIAVEAGLVDGALDPFDLVEIDAEVVLHQAADEDRGGLGVERHADALAGEVLGRLDVLAVDDDEAVAEHPRGEHRQRHERQLLGGIAGDEFGARHFAGVEFQPVGHAVENLARIVHDQEIEIDAVGFDVAGMEREHAIVEAAGEGDRQGGHWVHLLCRKFEAGCAANHIRPAAWKPQIAGGHAPTAGATAMLR